MIPDSFKRDLLNRVDIIDLIQRHLPLKKAGANYSACCPFHNEKSPSFTVSPSKQFYHCFGCGAHGDAIGFLMEYSGLGYIEAIKELAAGAGMTLPDFEPRFGKKKEEDGPDLYDIMQRASQYYREQLKASPHAIEYLKRRGLSGQVAARFGIGYAPEGWQNLQAAFPKYDDKSLKDAGLVIENDAGKRSDRFRDRIMFPIVNQRGFVIGFGGRVIGAGEPKYLNSPETPLFEKGRELYGLPQARQAIRDAGRVLVVEGYMDVAALAQHGVEYAVATLGTATTPVHVHKLLRQADEVVFSFDGDAAGRKAAWHALEMSLPATLDQKAIRFLFLPEGEDPDSYVRAEGKQAFEDLVGRAEPLSAYLLTQLRARVDTNTAEGRSRLLHEAKPLVMNITSAPALQLQLLKQVADLAGMTQTEVEQQWELRRTKAFTSAWEKPELPKLPRTAPQSVQRWLLKRMLIKSGLARELPLERFCGEDVESRGLVALAEYSLVQPEQGGNFDALVIDHFRGTEFETLFNQLRSELMVLNLSPEQAEAEFRDSLPKLERDHIDQQLNELQAKVRIGAFSRADADRMNELTKRKAALDQRPSGNRSVV
ncbi:MAG: DNA primase [Betaproteobacteria bacterium]|nr:DNA primase [Betaproteobacteria bacterium]